MGYIVSGVASAFGAVTQAGAGYVIAEQTGDSAPLYNWFIGAVLDKFGAYPDWAPFAGDAIDAGLRNAEREKEFTIMSSMIVSTPISRYER